MKRFTLVAHPINHYGEKLRWCLDLVGAPYVESNIGAIILLLFRGRSVPWLVDHLSCSLIGNSEEATGYLLGVYVPTLPEPTRTQATRLLERTDEAIKWEAKLNTLGHLIQGAAYYYMLQSKSGERGCLTAWGAYEPHVPFFHRWALRLLFKPVLRSFMRKAFKHTGPKAEELQARRKEEIYSSLMKLMRC